MAECIETREIRHLTSYVDSSRQLNVYQQIAENLQRKLKGSLIAVLAHIGHLNKTVKTANQQSGDPLVDLQIDGIIAQQLLLLEQSVKLSMDKAFLVFESESIRLVQSSLNTDEGQITRKVMSQVTKDLKQIYNQAERLLNLPVTFDSVDRMLNQLPSKKV